ncbi:unnamed protein product [Candidula unifasciata]|uniref:Kinesin motor domain-containing protein n=1 Tax=Candidula unifasciata TaxID=100452 RepID=A0A8S3YPF5_9EUPU|nr:unnamed protein product [Candidula unifasciata]
MAQIKTYARLKPTKKPYSGYEISRNILTVHIPDNRDVLVLGSHQAVRSNLSYDIVFTDIFRPEATQEDVFDGVAKGIIQSFLNGYNGTIFAYGQTGTGKTYTVEGNSTNYNTRGLSTRALSMIYQQLENRMDDHITVCLSYLEIYQEVAYDLLNPISRSSLPLAPFAKVTVVEGPRGSCIFRGLSLHLAANEEIAQMLLLQGQANRKVAETPVNQRSSRSHAVFTVYLQVRKHDSDVLLNSKLHLVDLAGSERVSKTGVDGQQLTEAKSINLSLHHLETVIIALQTDRSTSSSSTAGGDRSRIDNPPSQSRSNTSFMSGPSSDSGTKPYKYVPYRNSLLTMVLKDSLGGNCLTAMIATISMEPENLGESISTCRFAQRVARIANNARRNEEVDDKTVIKRLKHKVANLEHELSVLRSKGMSESTITDDDLLTVLTEDDRTTCAKIMEGFLQGAIADPVDAGIYDQSRFRECLKLLKRQYLHSLSSNSPQLQTAQQLQQQQSRQVVVDHPSEAGHQLQPNNPHRDSGDHNMSDVTQTDSSILFSQQRPAVGSASLLQLQASSDAMLSSEDRTLGAVNTSDVDKKSNEHDQYVETCGNDTSRPHYDRQNTKDHKKHGSQKLSLLEQEQALKQEHLAQMSQDILMQELLAAENNLRLKLQVVEEQVAEQHAYVTQLRHNQVDVAQIAREQLVEQHLLKRQAKFRAKLSKLLDNKAKLQYTLASGRELSAPVYPAFNRSSVEDKFNQFKQGKGCHNWQLSDALKSEGNDQYKESSSKLDRDRLAQKSRHLDKEITIQEKIREHKQKLKQQQEGPIFEFNVEHRDNPPETQPTQNSRSIDSNRSQRGSSCPCSCVNSYLEGSLVVEAESTHNENKTCPSNASSKTVLHLKEPSFPEVTRAAEQQGKYFKEYVFSGNLDKAFDDYRQGKYSGSKAGEVSKRYESGGAYSVRNTISPYQHSLNSLNSPVFLTKGDITDNATQKNQSALVDFHHMNEAKPVEVRSFHDPHHSHKFALDDMPAECMNLSNPMTGVTDNNKNNSFLQLVNNGKHQLMQSIDYNCNAHCYNCNWTDMDTEKQCLASCFERQIQMFTEVSFETVFHTSSRISLEQRHLFHDNGEVVTKQPESGAAPEVQTQYTRNQKGPATKHICLLGRTSNEIAKKALEQSNEELKDSVNLLKFVPNSNHKNINLPACLHVRKCEENVKTSGKKQNRNTPTREFQSDPMEKRKGIDFNI